jgi:hypothetical protein
MLLLRTSCYAHTTRCSAIVPPLVRRPYDVSSCVLKVVHINVAILLMHAAAVGQTAGSHYIPTHGARLLTM